MKKLFSLAFLIISFVISAGYAEDSLRCPGDRTHQILLTFDDGPHVTRTPQVLNVLREHDVRALFFVSGSSALKSSHDKVRVILERMKREGHLIGYHAFEHWPHGSMMSHEANYIYRYNSGVVKNEDEMPKVSDTYNYKRISNDYILRNLFRGLNETFLNEYVGPFFRLPYGDGADNSAIKESIEQRGFRSILWDMDSLDYMSQQYTFSERVVKVQQSLCRNGGGIILMHDIQPHTPKELREWIRLMRDAGHEIVGPEKVRYFVK